MAPPAACGAAAKDETVETLAFGADNLMASPSPPAGLTPANAPQIVVFGWDDVENEPGMAFVNQLIGSLTNPNNKKASCNVNPNACYGGSPRYACGDGSLVSARARR